MEQWEEGFYITAMAGSNAGSSLVVMSKGTPYTQQSYKVSDSFPFKWISKKWKEGFHVTSMATSKCRWAVVMSRNAGFVDQCVELDFQYPSEGIHRRWDAGESRSILQLVFSLLLEKRRMLAWRITSNSGGEHTIPTEAFRHHRVGQGHSKLFIVMLRTAYGSESLL